MKSWVFFMLVFSMSTLCAQDLLKASIDLKNVSAMKFTPDNQYLIAASGSKAIIYSAGSDTRIKELTGIVGAIHSGHTKNILDLAFSRDSKLMVTASADKSVKLWTIPEGKITFNNTSHTEQVVGVGFGDDDRLLISVSEKGMIKAWDRINGKILFTKKDQDKSIRAFDMTVDGKRFAMAGEGRNILIYESATGNLLQTLSAHTNWVRAIAFSPDGKTLASGGDDKMIYLWEVETCAKLKELPQKAWTFDLEYSQDGRYLAAASERNSVSFYNQAGVISLHLDKMRSAVHKIAISPNGKEVASVEEFGSGVDLWNIASLNITQVIRFNDSKDKLSPLIFVSNPANLQDNRVVVYKDILDLRGTVTDESGVRSLRINGIETPIRENGNFLINIPLAAGENYFTVEVTDVNDNIALKKFIVTRKNMGGEEYNRAIAKNHLLVVGINGYQFWPKLNNAVKDANDIVSVLMTKYNFEFSNITLLKEEQATRTNIYNGMRSLIERVSPQDNLVIYFSGHGYFDQLLNEGYWIPIDAHPHSSGEYISNTDILKILSSINSQHTFLIADACFSGSLFSDSRRGYTDNVEKFKSRWGLASGRLETVSDGAIGGNSPFATWLLAFFKENEKDKFAISELIQFVKTHVAAETNQTPIGNPLKALGDEGGEMVFYKKKN